MAVVANAKLTFKVVEAQAKDVGRAIARLDPKDMERLGLEVGEVIQIEGKRKTVAKVMPAYPEDRGKATIQIDGLVRENAKASLDEKVAITKAKAAPAEKIVLSPLTLMRSAHRGSDRYLGSLLEGLPMVEGDRIRATLFGTQNYEFSVVSTHPKNGPVVIHPNTTIQLQTVEAAEEKRGLTISYEDIGGLRPQIQRIREMIELPLKYPEVFERLGIEPPKGVLLYGPPGSGKTLIAKAVVNETDAYFTHISGPEIMCVGPNTSVYVDGRLMPAEELYALLKRDAEIVQGGSLRETIKPRKQCAVKSLDPNLRITDGVITEATRLTAESFEVELDNGTCLTVSANQPFATLDPLGHLTWTMVRDLHEGDHVAVAGGFETPITSNVEWFDKLDEEHVYATVSEAATPKDGRLKVKLKTLVELPHDELRQAIQGIELWTSRGNERRAKPIKPVWDLSPDLGRFLGGMYAEGSIANRLDEVCYSNNDEELKNEYAELFSTLFGIGRERIKIRRGKVYVHSYILSHVLNRVFGLPIGLKTGQLHVPPILFSAPIDCVTAFLSGLFDGDGTPHVDHDGYPSPRLFSKDETFLREVQTLLISRVSIPNRISPWPTAYGQMHALNIVTRQGRNKFFQSVSPSSHRFKTAELPERSGKGVGEDIIPVAPLLKKIKEKLGVTYGKDIPESSVEPYISGRFPLTRRKLRQIAGLLKAYGDLPEFEQVERLVTAQISLSRVTRITQMAEQVLFDFGVEPHSNFLGGLPLVPLHNSKFYGESEQKLRAIFNDAQAHAPAILFIDEIDAIAPKREEMGGEKQVERRVVAQLLALMDGLESRGQLIVIAATNIPNVIDPALRRPGRFDREISIPIPDRNARLEILHIHTRGMPLAKDVDLERLADITHGFVGADLMALCREAAMVTLRQLFPEVDFDLAEIPVEKLMKLEVTQDAFLEAMKDIEPSAIREVFVEVPNVTWNDVGGLDDIKNRLIEAVEWPLKYTAVFAQAKVRPPKGMLLTGPPGCGKTLLVKALAHESEVNFISVKGPELMSKYVGESERGIREIFRKAKQAAPCVTGDTVVVLGSGKEVTIKELFDQRLVGETVWSFDDTFRTVPKRIVAIQRKPPQPVVQVETPVGRVKCTPDHLFPVIQDERVDWIPAYQLRSDDRVAAPRQLRIPDRPLFTLDLMPDNTALYGGLVDEIYEALVSKALDVRAFGTRLGLTKKQLKSRLRARIQHAQRGEGKFFLTVGELKGAGYVPSRMAVTHMRLYTKGWGESQTCPLRVPKEIDPELMYVHGLIWSDGTYPKGGAAFRFCGDSLSLHQRLRHILHEKFGLDPCEARVGERHVITYSSSRAIVALFHGIRARLLELPETLLAAWLRGVCDGDGSITPDRKKISIGATKPGNRELLQKILLRLGIPTIDHRGNNLELTSQSQVSVFLEKVGFEHPEKALRAQGYASQRSMSRLDVIPVGKLVRAVRSEMGLAVSEVGVPQTTVRYWEAGLSIPSRERVQTLVRHLTSRGVGETDEALAQLNKLANSDLFWVPVISVKHLPDKEAVYDLQVEETENFLANGLFVHNCVLFFDEIDSVVPRRGAGGGDSLVAERVISQFLTELDGIEELKGVLVVAATNRPDLVDAALLRPGRFDLILELLLPDEKSRQMIFHVHTRGKPLAKDVDLNGLAKETEGLTGADIEAICREAAMDAIREAIHTKHPSSVSITMKHFQAASAHLKVRSSHEHNPPHRT